MKLIFKKLLPTKLLRVYRKISRISDLENRIVQLERAIDNIWITRRFEITRDELTEINYKDNHFITEAEHQIGRLINIERIIKIIKENNITGDFIEFGVFKGLSLIWLARFREQYGLTDKKIIGIDSFKGLPISSGGWGKGQFNNTSIEILDRNLKNYLTHNEQMNIEIIKGWFADSSVTQNLKKVTDKLSLVHLDCDLGVSAEDAFNVLEPFFKKGGGIKYLLMDDWGCNPNEIPVAFENWKKKHPYISTSLFSETRLTRYYKVIC